MTARRRVVRTREPCSGAVDGVDSVAGRVLGVMGITVASFVAWFVLVGLLQALLR